MNYPRTSEGFNSAFNAIKSIAGMHPDKEYVLYVDSRSNDRYGITLKGLYNSEYLESNTVAHVVTASGEMIEV